MRHLGACSFSQIKQWDAKGQLLCSIAVYGIFLCYFWSNVWIWLYNCFATWRSGDRSFFFKFYGNSNTGRRAFMFQLGTICATIVYKASCSLSTTSLPLLIIAETFLHSTHLIITQTDKWHLLNTEFEFIGCVATCNRQHGIGYHNSQKICRFLITRPRKNIWLIW